MQRGRPISPKAAAINSTMDIQASGYEVTQLLQFGGDVATYRAHLLLADIIDHAERVQRYLTPQEAA